MSTRAHVRVGGAPGALELQLPAISLLVNDLAEIHRTAVAELAREVAKLMTWARSDTDVPRQARTAVAMSCGLASGKLCAARKHLRKEGVLRCLVI